MTGEAAGAQTWEAGSTAHYVDCALDKLRVAFPPADPRREKKIAQKIDDAMDEDGKAEAIEFILRAAGFTSLRQSSTANALCTLCGKTMPGTAHEDYVHVCTACTDTTFDLEVLQAPDMPPSCPHHDQAVANCSCCHAEVVRMRNE